MSKPAEEPSVWQDLLRVLHRETPQITPAEAWDRLQQDFGDVKKDQVKHALMRIRKKAQAEAEGTKPQDSARPCELTAPLQADPMPSLHYRDPFSKDGSSSCTQEPQASPEAKPGCWELQTSKTGGLGVFAKCDIEPGELIFWDQPAMVVKLKNAGIQSKLEEIAEERDSIMKSFDDLEDGKKAEVLSLSSFMSDFLDDPELDEGGLASGLRQSIELMRSSEQSFVVASIFLTNAIPVGEGRWGLCCGIARFNHSCSPNAEYVTASTQVDCYVRATRHIKAGEEISVHYAELDHRAEQNSLAFRPTAERQAWMKVSFGQACKCIPCQQDDPASDEKRKSICRLFHAIPMAGSQVEEQAWKLLHLMQEVGVMFPSLLRQLAHDVCFAADRKLLDSRKTERLLFWRRLAYELQCYGFGESRPYTQELKSKMLQLKEKMEKQARKGAPA
ncbi:unnamed protein product [Symbiodinium natans]|uniref:SET domain-containing protein n=1 Tax=Symbiodinium natans TaxID=878477 RepID=A0A812G0X4_9DINO|nr:unnamed protein product [Symbiodinium natans]